MCGRFTLRGTATEIARHFRLQQVLPLEPRYNIAPSEPVAVVRVCPETGRQEMVFMRWGLIPRWSAKADAAPAVINARCETAHRRRLFRESLLRRRCLIPADGFYEWRRTGGIRQPYLIELGRGELFALAGIWDQWQASPDGPPLLSCTVLTMPARGTVARLHDRMPLALAEESYGWWLEAPAESLVPPQRLFARAVPAARWQARPVSQAVNSAGNKGPEVLQPPEAPFLPGLELESRDETAPKNGSKLP